MLAALSVCEVGTVVLVHGETEAALEAADVVAEEVGVFVEVDGFESEFSESFAAVGVGCALGGDAAATEFGAGAVLIVHGCGRGWVKLCGIG